MKRQKGQSVIEFALVFPFFIIVIWLLSIFGFLFIDYLTLSNVARSSAREASILGSGSYGAIRTSYSPTDGSSSKHTTLLSDLYTWQGNESDFEFDNSESGIIKVTITTRLNNTFLGFNMARLMGALPPSYKIEYSMYDESSGSGS